MVAKAVGKYFRISPRKARAVADLVRGKNVEEAMAILKFTNKKAAGMIAKVLKSAMANAEENHGVKDVSKLYIKEIRVDGGPTWKRYMPRAYGRATLIRKRTSHITIVLAE
ncbi:50S ribosomal protein L22 [Deferribacter thermophilus]|uniref:50S ribosomal protein L22 n=1 Tax=Deferribacter thermophilus TaxID=53573 RepID=UPI003C24C86F